MVRLRPWLAALLPLLLARAARAEPPPHEPAALSWVRSESAAGCPDATAIARAVEQRLGREALVAPSEAALMVEAYVEAAPGGGFRATIALIRAGQSVGRRELENSGATCQALAEQAALVIALTIDPEAPMGEASGTPVLAGSPAPAAAKPEPTPPCEPKAEPARALAPRPAEPKSDTEWHGELELAGGIATGIVPDLAPGVFARGRALPPRLPFAVELSGAYFPPADLESSPGKGADVALFHVGAALCSRPQRSSRIRASLCGGADVGAVAGRGYGFSSTPRFRTWTLALAARGRLGFLFAHRLAAVVGPNLAVPLKRDRFEVRPVTGTEELFRMSPIGLGFELGAVWEL